MIGDMIAKIRKEKRMTKTELSSITGINIGHLTHIEKGERNPSHKALKKISQALDTPYRPLSLLYDQILNEDQTKYGILNHISPNKVLAIDSVSGFIDCPSSIPSASIAVKVTEDSMSPELKVDSYVFVELNSPLVNNDIGLFNINDDILIRKFTIKNGKITLKANNKTYSDIKIVDNDTFYIIGKVFV